MSLNLAFIRLKKVELTKVGSLILREKIRKNSKGHLVHKILSDQEVNYISMNF